MTGYPYHPETAEGFDSSSDGEAGADEEKAQLSIRGRPPHGEAAEEIAEPTPEAIRKPRVSPAWLVALLWLTVNRFRRPGSMKTQGPAPMCPCANWFRYSKLARPKTL